MTSLLEHAFRKPREKHGLPSLGYTAIAAAPKPLVVQGNMYQAINNNLRNASEGGTYQVGKVRLPSNFTELGQAPTATSEPPKWKDTDYTTCRPQGFELPLLPTEIEQWQNCGGPALAEEMNRLVEKHNQELKPSGKAWPRPRGHVGVDKDPEEPSPELATKVQRTQREPETNEQLIAATGSCDTNTYAKGTYDLIITS